MGSLLTIHTCRQGKVWIRPVSREMTSLVGLLVKVGSALFFLLSQLSRRTSRGNAYYAGYFHPGQLFSTWTLWLSQPAGVSWCCGNYCLLAFVLWCGYCSVSFQSFVLRHWCPQHQETTQPALLGSRQGNQSMRCASAVACSWFGQWCLISARLSWLCWEDDPPFPRQLVPSTQANHNTCLGNWPPTPHLSQHFALSEK